MVCWLFSRGFLPPLPAQIHPCSLHSCVPLLSPHRPISPPSAARNIKGTRSVLKKLAFLFPLLRIYHPEQAQVLILQTAPQCLDACSGKQGQLLKFFCRHNLCLNSSWNEMKSCHQSHLWHRGTPVFHTHVCTETHAEGKKPRTALCKEVRKLCLSALLLWATELFFSYPTSRHAAHQMRTRMYAICKMGQQ